MWKNYFKTALRNLARNKWVTLISILGLSVGMASGLLSYLHIQGVQFLVSIILIGSSLSITRQMNHISEM
ncbi:MAG: hypothetical protein J5I98_04760 [Phaeodactylibacter sp.]|nr:hypothetical protein [Phaeodactylibacter sp.]